MIELSHYRDNCPARRSPDTTAVNAVRAAAAAAALGAAALLPCVTQPAQAASGPHTASPPARSAKAALPGSASHGTPRGAAVIAHSPLTATASRSVVRPAHAMGSGAATGAGPGSGTANGTGAEAGSAAGPGMSAGAGEVSADAGSGAASGTGVAGGQALASVPGGQFAATPGGTAHAGAAGTVAASPAPAVHPAHPAAPARPAHPAPAAHAPSTVHSGAHASSAGHSAAHPAAAPHHTSRPATTHTHTTTHHVTQHTASHPSHPATHATAHPAAHHTAHATAAHPARQPGSPSSDVLKIWDELAMCESSGRWHINSGNGFYGGLQFYQPTWRRFGGGHYAGRADLASRLEQIDIARAVQRAQGWKAWPVCSRKLGLSGMDAGGGAADSAAGSVSAAAEEAAGSASGATHTITSGETLSGIAQAHHVRGGWSRLYRLNKAAIGSDPDRLAVGTVLRLS